nr:reverse transcriptase domain-containing protein [Tanacetum cinerariifolium]
MSPWKGVARFEKNGKLAPRFVGPFEITERIGPVAYRLRLSEELNGVHDTFHVSNLKKCLADSALQVPLDEIQVDAKLNFMEEHVETFTREFKKLKRSRIAIIKALDAGDLGVATPREVGVWRICVWRKRRKGNRVSWSKSLEFVVAMPFVDKHFIDREDRLKSTLY